MELDIEKLSGLLADVKHSSLLNLNVLGADIFKFSSLQRFLMLLSDIQAVKTFHFHYLNGVEGIREFVRLNAAHVVLNILVTFPFSDVRFADFLKASENLPFRTNFVFAVQDEMDCEKAESIISSWELSTRERSDIIYRPYFNGKNLDFFKQHVFFSKENVLEKKIGLKDIHANSAINRESFGRITILNNGHIHANVNHPRIGVLGNASLHEILCNELRNGKSWRKIRKNVSPCKGCVFEALCPPYLQLQLCFQEI